MAGRDVHRELGQLIAEYLERRGLKQTLSAFKDESKDNPTESADLQSDFVLALECGEREVFFQLWRDYVPVRLRDSDPTTHHLECSVAAYFAVYPIRTGSGDKEKAMAVFRGYLESRGGQLSQSTELASLFALPYVPNPSTHPSFKNLFLDSWTVELKARLIQFLESNLPTATETPSLVKLYLKSERQEGVMVQDDCVAKLSELQHSYHTLVGIAMELVSALESSIAGRPITPEYIQSICTRLFQSSTVQHQPEPPKPMLNSTQNSSLLRASVVSLRQSLQASNGYSLTDTELDYKRIKSALVGEIDHASKALLIQALRWRLTRSSPGNQRDAVLNGYVAQDILGCSGSDSTHQAAVIQLMKTSDHQLKEQLSRLFNTFASLAGGRSYISQSPSIIKALLHLMYGERSKDTHARRNCLGAVQKLSLRRSIVRMMIKTSVVQFLGECLLAQPGSEYTVRYSLALLLNVSLRCIGKTYCKRYAEPLLTVLGEYLEHEDQEICNYVNGALYSLLACPAIRDAAKRMGMEEMLGSALRASPPELQSQLQYILTQLHSEATEPDDSGDEGNSDEEDDEEDDPDIIEGDEEELLSSNGALSGEELLRNKYSLSAAKNRPPSAKESKEQFNTTYSKPGLIRHDGHLNLTTGSEGEAPHVRPVTPQSFRPHTASSQTPVSHCRRPGC